MPSRKPRTQQNDATKQAPAQDAQKLDRAQVENIDKSIKRFSLVILGIILPAIALLLGPEMAALSFIGAGVGAYMAFPDAIDKWIDTHQIVLVGAVMGFIFGSVPGAVLGLWVGLFIDSRINAASEKIERVKKAAAPAVSALSWINWFFGDTPKPAAKARNRGAADQVIPEEEEIIKEKPAKPVTSMFDRFVEEFEDIYQPIPKPNDEAREAPRP